MLGLLLLSCAPEVADPRPEYVFLTPVEHAARASLVLRGVRATGEELASVARDPSALDGLVDEWVRSPEFGLVAMDMYAEWLHVRADVLLPLPALGPFRDTELDAMATTFEMPLELVRHVVDGDRPLTDLVTTDVVWTNSVGARVYGLPYDRSEGAPEWQETRWVDGRPAAGLLSDSEVWRRQESAGSNFGRLRANFVADAFLCSSFAGRDIVVEGGVTLSDEFEVAEAVSTQAECIGCHQSLDPLAVQFFGFKKQMKRSTVVKGYEADCDPQQSDDPLRPYAPRDYCYPLQMYSPNDEDWWEYWQLPAPGYYGRPVADLGELGEQIAADPRFAQCTSRRFYAWMTQSEAEDVPLSLAAELQTAFVDSGYSARALAKAVVMSDGFRAVRPGLGQDPEVAPAGVQILRPEQFARSVEALTGFAWVVDPDLPGCEVDRGNGTDCWGQVDLLRSDLFGFRSMAGGIDGDAVTTPIHHPTPPRELAWRRYAAEAAGFVVREDAARPREERRLLRELDDLDADPEAVATQVAAWFPELLGRFVAPDDPEVLSLVDLWADKRARASAPEAWSLVLTALLLDPDGVFF